MKLGKPTGQTAVEADGQTDRQTDGWMGEMTVELRWKGKANKNTLSLKRVHIQLGHTLMHFRFNLN